MKNKVKSIKIALSSKIMITRVSIQSIEVVCLLRDDNRTSRIIEKRVRSEELW